jgi:hypothetical protein
MADVSFTAFFAAPEREISGPITLSIDLESFE